MESLFKSEEGKRNIIDLYNQKLKTLNIAYTEHDVPTKFGETHVIECGNTTKPPIFIIHGSNGHAPIALETYSNLLEDFHVFAVDVLGQPNKSDTVVLSMNDLSYGQWMEELIHYFNFESVYVAGFSFGGLIILKTLEYNQQLVQKAFLSAPAYIVNGNPLKAIFKMFIPMLWYMKTGNLKKLDTFLKALFTNPDQYAFDFLSVVFNEFKMDFSSVPVISKKEAGKIKCPIVIYAAENDIIFPGDKMISRVSKIFPKSTKTVLLTGSKHVQNKVDNNKIQEMIIQEVNP